MCKKEEKDAKHFLCRCKSLKEKLEELPEEGKLITISEEKLMKFLFNEINCEKKEALTRMFINELYKKRKQFTPSGWLNLKNKIK